VFVCHYYCADRALVRIKGNNNNITEADAYNHRLLGENAMDSHDVICGCNTVTWECPKLKWNELA